MARPLPHKPKHSLAGPRSGCWTVTGAGASPNFFDARSDRRAPRLAVSESRGAGLLVGDSRGRGLGRGYGWSSERSPWWSSSVVVFVSSGGGARRTARGPSAAGLLSGIRARGTYASLFLGGENLWRVGRRPLPVAAALLHNGLSPLLPHDDGGEVDQLAAVRGGVVAHISDTSSPITYGALGRVVFIPAAPGPARVIGRAIMIAVPPGGTIIVRTGYISLA
jgi:hypothetical protein